MDSRLMKIWPYLALAAAVVGTLLSKCPGIVIMFAVAAYSLVRFLLTDNGAEQPKGKEITERIAALRDTIQCQREQQVNLDRIILQLQQRLDYHEERQKAGDREERTRVLQITQEVLQQQGWQDRALSLEAQSLFLKKENDQEKREKQQLEDKILKIIEENQHLKDNAKEIEQRNATLCKTIKDLTAELAMVNYQLERYEKLLRQKEKDLKLKTEEASGMAKLIQEQNDATEKRESSHKDLELRFQRLQKEVEDLSKEKCLLQCELQKAKLERNELTSLLEERNGRLESLERKAGAQGKLNDQLKDEVRQLRGAKEKLVCDIKKLQEKLRHMEEDNCRLQKQLSFFKEWRDKFCAGLTHTDQI